MTGVEDAEGSWLLSMTSLCVKTFGPGGGSRGSKQKSSKSLLSSESDLDLDCEACWQEIKCVPCVNNHLIDYSNI